MKTFILFLITLLCSFPVKGIAVSDSTVYYVEPKSVIITENSTGAEVEVIDKNDGLHKFECQSRGNNMITASTRFNSIHADCCGNWYIKSSGLYLGFISTPGSDEAISPDMGKSIEFGWLNLISVERQLSYRWGVSLGFGLNNRSYRSTRGLVYESDEDHITVSERPIDGYRFSRIKIFSLQFPLLFKKSFSKRGGMTPGLSFGPIFNLNTSGSIMTSWKDEHGKNQKTVTKNIGQRFFTIDLYGQIRLGDLGIYVRYSPYKILQSSRLIDYQPLSVGISLGY